MKIWGQTWGLIDPNPFTKSPGMLTDLFYETVHFIWLGVAVTSQYLHLPLTSLRWTILDQLASYTDEGQLIKRRQW